MSLTLMILNYLLKIMIGMTKEFVSYELAKELKELGFIEPCLAFYNKVKNLNIAITTEGFVVIDKHPFLLPAPLYQQVFRWFRNEHNLFSLIDVVMDFSCFGAIIIKKGEEEILYRVIELETYEQTQDVCVGKMIELVKAKQNDKRN